MMLGMGTSGSYFGGEILPTGSYMAGTAIAPLGDVDLVRVVDAPKWWGGGPAQMIQPPDDLVRVTEPFTFHRGPARPPAKTPPHEAARAWGDWLAVLRTLLDWLEYPGGIFATVYVVKLLIDWLS